jgi:hypothetical protein
VKISQLISYSWILQKRLIQFQEDNKLLQEIGDNFNLHPLTLEDVLTTHLHPRIEIFDDSIRAMLVGRFFAIVNITACILQLFILPTILSYKTLPYVICIIPIIIFISILFGIFYPSLILVMFGFGTIKVLEYSIMHSASEMIYMPMGHEVRYVGKELIRYFGHKLGKSGISIICIYIYS